MQLTGEEISDKWATSLDKIFGSFPLDSNTVENMRVNYKLNVLQVLFINCPKSRFRRLWSHDPLSDADVTGCHTCRIAYEATTMK